MLYTEQHDFFSSTFHVYNTSFSKSYTTGSKINFYVSNRSFYGSNYTCYKNIFKNGLYLSKLKTVIKIMYMVSSSRFTECKLKRLTGYIIELFLSSRKFSIDMYLESRSNRGLIRKGHGKGKAGRNAIPQHVTFLLYVCVYKLLCLKLLPSECMSYGLAPALLHRFNCVSTSRKTKKHVFIRV